MNHQLTFGLVEAPVEHPEIHSDVVLSDELLLIMPPDHPLRDVEEPTFQPPARSSLRASGAGFRNAAGDGQEMRAGGLDPRNHVEDRYGIGQHGAVKSAVEAGLGLSVLSRSAVRNESVLGTIVTKRIRGLNFIRDFHAVYLKSTCSPFCSYIYDLFEKT